MNPGKFNPIKCTLIAFVITMLYVSVIALFFTLIG
jgi:hypothetical protein